MTTAEDAQEIERTWDRRSRFVAAALRRWLVRRRVALAISGGGSQGSFQAGALRFLYDHLALRPVAICGSSVGALIGAKLAEGDDPETGRRAVDEMEALWRSLRSNDDFWRAEPWLDKLRSEASWAAELREHLAEHGTNGAQVRLVLRMVGGLVRHAPVADGTIDALRQAMRARSMLSFEPIERLVAERLDPSLVAASGIVLRLGAVSLESGELRYITESGELVDRDNAPLGLPPVDLRAAVLASASIPVLFPPVRLGDEYYVDGGARQVLPIELAFEHLEADHIYAVVASAPGVDRSSSYEGKSLLEVARRVMTEIAPDETLRKEMYPPRGWSRKVTLIAPDFDVHDALLVDPDLIAASIDYGYMRAADVVLNLGDEARGLSTEITRIRLELRELGPPLAGLLRSPDQVAQAELAAHAAAGSEGQRLHDEQQDALLARLSGVIAKRRHLGAPLPPSAIDSPDTLGAAETG